MSECTEEDSLFDPSILDQASLEDWPKSVFQGDVTLKCPGEGLLLRPLKRNDCSRGYFSLLKQLSVVGSVDSNKFQDTFDRMRATKDTYFIIVIEDLRTNNIIGSATLFVERTFLHGCSKRAAIEDVVVCENFRGKQLGKVLMTGLILLAIHLKCYKMMLYCEDGVVPFYEGIGFEKDPNYPNFMSIYF